MQVQRPGEPEVQEGAGPGGSTAGPWRVQSKQGHQDPVCQDRGLDPAGGAGGCLNALCRGVTPHLCFEKIILTSIFL